MIETIHSYSVKKARKEFQDSSAPFLQEMWNDIGIRDIQLTFSEMREIVKLKQRGWKILKGMPYEYSYNKMDGETYAFRSYKPILEIMWKYDLFPEE